MSILVGLPILPGEATGDTYVPPTRSRGGILVSTDLTTEVALAAIEDDALAILTEQGSFACHGANVLRAHSRDTGRLIPWVSECLDAKQRLPPGSTVKIFRDGTVLHTSDRHSHRVVDVARGPMWRQQSIRDVVATSELGATLRCYWPHRTYDRLTASLMGPSLQTDAQSLAGCWVATWRDQAGHVWFSDGAPSTRNLATLAIAPALAKPHFLRQLSVYADLYIALAGFDSTQTETERLWALGQLVQQYFSAFLLYHATYEAVFSAFATPESLGESRCLLTSWVARDRIRLRNRKDLLDEPEPVPLAPFHVLDEPALSALPVRWPDAPALYAEAVLALKEWKFYLNKALFTRFADAAASVARQRGLGSVHVMRAFQWSELAELWDMTDEGSSE